LFCGNIADFRDDTQRRFQYERYERILAVISLDKRNKTVLQVYRTTFQFVRSHPATILVWMAVIFVVRFVVDVADAGSAGATIMWFVIAYYLHRSLMLNENNLIKPPKEFLRPQAIGRFICVSGGLFICMIVLALIAAFTLSQANDAASIIVLMLLSYAVLAIILLPIFGTMLPAAAAADAFGFGITLRRAKSTWYKILGGLLIGPGLFWAIYTGGLLWFTTNVIAIEPYYTATSGLQPGQIIIGLALAFLQLIGSLLTVVVLCLAYRDVASQEVKLVLEQAFPTQ